MVRSPAFTPRTQTRSVGIQGRRHHVSCWALLPESRTACLPETHLQSEDKSAPSQNRTARAISFRSGFGSSPSRFISFRSAISSR